MLGKDGHLYLKEGSAGVTAMHHHNVHSYTHQSFDKYLPFIDNFLLVICPDKHCIMPEFLPEGITARYRPGVDRVKSKLPDNYLDCLEAYQALGDCCYKTDAHANLRGAYRRYQLTIEKLNDRFGLDLEPAVCEITKTHYPHGIEQFYKGDLARPVNLGDLVLDTVADDFHESAQIPQLVEYLMITDPMAYQLQVWSKAGVNITESLLGQKLTWACISANIIITHNSESKTAEKFLIFYDSCLVSTYHLWLSQFRELILVKERFDPMYIERYQPDFVMEVRTERFLGV